MKASDLMIGDWVKSRGKIEQVTEVYDGYICTDSFEDSHDYYFKPIPITPKILEKNGWKNSAPDVWQKEYRGFVFYWEKGTGRFGMDDFIHQEQWKMHLRIKYVHELQHALRLCGIEKK